MMAKQLVDVAPAENENENMIISPPTLRQRAVDQVFATDNLVQSILLWLPPAFRFVAATKGLRRNFMTVHDGTTSTSVRYALQAIPTARIWAAEQPAVGFDCVDRVKRYATMDVMRDFLLQQDYPWSAVLAEPLECRELLLVLELTLAFNKRSSSYSSVDNDSIILPMVVDGAEAEAMMLRLSRILYQLRHGWPRATNPLTQLAWEANEARIKQWLATTTTQQPPSRVVASSWQCQACMIPNDDTNATRCQVCRSVRD
jgi:hypothetical protein